MMRLSSFGADRPQAAPRSRQALAVLAALAAAAMVTACGGGSGGDKSATATLAVLETTDLHFNIRSYDYFKLADDPSYGFERTATLIRKARSEFANTLLVWCLKNR